MPSFKKIRTKTLFLPYLVASTGIPADLTLYNSVGGINLDSFSLRENSLLTQTAVEATKKNPRTSLYFIYSSLDRHSRRLNSI